MPALKPVSTGDEMKFATKPNRNSRANTNIAPTSAVSVAVAVTSFAGSPSGTASPSCVPARMASVVVELTLKTRDEPSSAYINIGTKAVYRPTATGSPATVAYAMAFGRTTAADVRPAMRSPRNAGSASRVDRLDGGSITRGSP